MSQNANSTLSDVRNGELNRGQELSIEIDLNVPGSRHAAGRLAGDIDGVGIAGRSGLWAPEIRDILGALRAYPLIRKRVALLNSVDDKVDISLPWPLQIGGNKLLMDAARSFALLHTSR